MIGSRNPFLLREGRRGAVAAEIAVRPTVTWSLPPGSKVELAGVLVDRQYTRRYGNIATGRFDLTGRHRRDERLSLSVAGHVARDQTVDALSSPIEAAADPQSFRNSYGVRAAATWNFDARTSLSPSIGAESTSFTGTEVLADTRALDFGAILSRRLNAYTSFGLRGTAFLGRVGGSDNDIQTLVATLDRRLRENWRGTIELGVERSGARREIWLGTPIVQEARVRFGGRIEGCYDTSRTQGCLSGSLRSEVTGLGGLQRERALRGTVRHVLSDRASVEMLADYRRSTVQGTGFGALDVLRGQATFERRLNERFVVAGVVEYLRRRTLTGERIGAAFLGAHLRYRLNPR